MMRKLASRRATSRLTVDELESEAWTGAIKAVQSYDPTKGASLSTWVYAKARFAIEDAVRRECRRRERETARDPACFSLFAPVFSESNDETPNAALQVAWNALETLDERSRELIERILINGESRADVARALEISKNYCGALYRKAVAKLRETARRAAAEMGVWTKEDAIQDEQG